MTYRTRCRRAALQRMRTVRPIVADKRLQRLKRLMQMRRTPSKCSELQLLVRSYFCHCPGLLARLQRMRLRGHVRRGSGLRGSGAGGRGRRAGSLMLSAVLEKHAAGLATLDRIALLLADTPTAMESTSEEAKDRSKHDREHYRRHNREIDADISARTLVLDIAR